MCVPIFLLCTSQCGRFWRVSRMLADPHEKEILFSPLMGQQALATRVLGSTLIVDTRLNLNMQSLTLEEVASKRRKLLEDTQQSMASEVRRALAGTGYEEVGVRMFEAEVRRSGKLYSDAGEKHDAEWFNADENLRQIPCAILVGKRQEYIGKNFPHSGRRPGWHASYIGRGRLLWRPGRQRVQDGRLFGHSQVELRRPPSDGGAGGQRRARRMEHRL